MLENIWSEGNRLEDRNLEQQSSILNISGLPRLTVVINSVWSGSRSSRTVSKSGSAFPATIRRFYFLRFLIGNSRVILKRGKISKNSLIPLKTWYSTAISSYNCNFVQSEFVMNRRYIIFCGVDKIDAEIKIHLISIKILDTYLGMVVCRISRWALKSSLWIWWGWGCVGRG